MRTARCDGGKQMLDRETTVNANGCDGILMAAPIDLSRLMQIDRACIKVRYRLAVEGNALAEAVVRVATGGD